MTKVCTECGYVGKPVSQGIASFAVDAFIWLFFTGIFLATFLLPLMLIPVAWTLYHVFTYFSITCRECENFNMVSLQSAEGKMSLLRWKNKNEVHNHASSEILVEGEQQAA